MLILRTGEWWRSNLGENSPHALEKHRGCARNLVLRMTYHRNEAQPREGYPAMTNPTLPNP